MENQLKNQKLPVLIVGAGPTGLVSALQLKRYGIPFRMIDKHAAPLQLSKAAALHARTLEVFADLGVIDQVLAQGQQVDILDLRTRFADRLRLKFDQLKNTRYPFMLDIPQYRVENILMEKLEEQGVQIERGLQLVGLEQRQDRVEVRLRYQDGRDESFTAAWVVGADGSKSTTRSLIGLDFPGEAYADDWVLSDAVLKWPLPRNEMTFSSSAEGIFGVFPLPGQNNYRLAYTQSRDAAGQPVEPSLEDVQRSLNRTGIQGEVLKADQFWTFNLAHRQVKEYRKGKVFLLGDAAHIHTPFGGQGMNLGISDAYNLGWKLALVVRGQASPALLNSYQPERSAVVGGVIKTTHLGVVSMLVKGGRQGRLRDALMQLAGSSGLLPARLTVAFSQLSHHYHDSPIVKGRSLRLRAGDRAPDQPFFDGQSQSYRRISDLTAGTCYTLLLFVGDKADQLAKATRLADEIQTRFAGLLKVHLITTAYALPKSTQAGVEQWSDRGKDLSKYHQFGLTTAYLVRPDKYLGYIKTNPNLSDLESYLQKTLQAGKVPA